MEYEPGTGSLSLFPSMHLETCEEPITSIQANIELETNHIGKGCDRDTYSEKSLHRLCGTNTVHNWGPLFKRNGTKSLAQGLLNSCT